MGNFLLLGHSDLVIKAAAPVLMWAIVLYVNRPTHALVVVVFLAFSNFTANTTGCWFSVISMATY
jgi:hypothetical protein